MGHPPQESIEDSWDLPCQFKVFIAMFIYSIYKTKHTWCIKNLCACQMKSILTTHDPPQSSHVSLISTLNHKPHKCLKLCLESRGAHIFLYFVTSNGNVAYQGSYFAATIKIHKSWIQKEGSCLFWSIHCDHTIGLRILWYNQQRYFILCHKMLTKSWLVNQPSAPQCTPLRNKALIRAY